MTYLSEECDTLEAAIAAQHKALMENIAEGRAIRECGIEVETDSETKRRRFLAHVRPHLFAGEALGFVSGGLGLIQLKSGA